MKRGNSVNSRICSNQTVKENVKTLEERGRDTKTKSNINMSARMSYIPTPLKSEDQDKNENKEVSNKDDKIDLLLSLMVNQGNKLDDHITKYDDDMVRIKEKLERIEENSRQITKNREDIEDLQVGVDEVNSRVDEVNVKVANQKAEIDENNTNVLRELESRPTLESVEAMIKEQVSKETAHLIEIMKNLLAEATKSDPVPVTNVFPSLEQEEQRPRYSEAANRTMTVNFPAFPNPPPLRNNPTVHAMQVIKDTFSETQAQENLISHYKQIIGLKPVTRSDLEFHARAVGVANVETISDSILFYCPTFHSFRVSFAHDFLYEVFGIQKNEINISEVRMCNKLSSKILWITIGENSARHIFGLCGRIQRKDINIIHSIPPNMIERRRAIVIKMEKIRELNPTLRYQIRLGKNDFRLFSKKYKSTEYTKFREVALRVIDPLDQFPKPLKNQQPHIDDTHARMIADAVRKAKEASERANDDEWNTVGKRLLTPEKAERNIRAKLNSPEKINATLNRIIDGEKLIDLGDIGIDAEEETIVRTVKPAVPQPGSVVLHTEEVTEDDDGEHMIDNHDETMILVNSGASCSSQKQ